jgi:biopolymer transport protein ExbB
MFEIIRANFWALLPIILLSCSSIAIIIERLLYFRSVKENAEITRRAGGLFSQGKNESALEALGNVGNSAERALLLYAIENRFVLDDALRRRLELIGRNRLALLEKNVAFLNTIANVATLFGLLGTIIGMIMAFAAMNNTGSSDPYILAGGISRALVSTAAGLITAIPSLLAYHYFAENIARKTERMNNLIAEILQAKGVRL